MLDILFEYGETYGNAPGCGYFAVRIIFDLVPRYDDGDNVDQNYDRGHDSCYKRDSERQRSACTLFPRRTR